MTLDMYPNRRAASLEAGATQSIDPAMQRICHKCAVKKALIWSMNSPVLQIA